jgi:membrane protein
MPGLFEDRRPAGGFWERFRLARFAELIAETGREWLADNAPRLGAALAFYSVLSAAPLLVITIAIVGAFVGEQTARTEIVAQTQQLVGESGAAAIKEMLANMRQSGAGVWAGLLGVITLLVGASGVFGELQASMNTIWNVPPKPDQTVWTILRDRFLSFMLVFGTGFLLLVLLVVNAGVAAFGRFIQDWLPGQTLLLQVTNVALSLMVTTFLFAFLFRRIPDVKVTFGDVLPGAVLTALLFALGKTLLGLYLAWAGVGSAYGAAGSLVVLLIWIYYSSQLFLFGAEFTQVYTKHYGTRRS